MVESGDCNQGISDAYWGSEMRRNERQEIMRRIVGAILASGLSSENIAIFSDELMSNVELSFELGVLLRKHMEIIGTNSPEGLSGNADVAPPWLSLMFDSVARKGLSKRELISLIARFKKLDVSMTTLQRFGVREILIRTFEDSSAKEISAFLKLINGDITSDPYLKGIEQR
jgi:hypothetical protein